MVNQLGYAGSPIKAMVVENPYSSSNNGGGGGGGGGEVAVVTGLYDAFCPHPATKNLFEVDGSDGGEVRRHFSVRAVADNHVLLQPSSVQMVVTTAAQLLGL